MNNIWHSFSCYPRLKKNARHFACVGWGMRNSFTKELKMTEKDEQSQFGPLVNSVIWLFTYQTCVWGPLSLCARLSNCKQHHLCMAGDKALPHSWIALPVEDDYFPR